MSIFCLSGCAGCRHSQEANAEILETTVWETKFVVMDYTQVKS